MSKSDTHKIQTSPIKLSICVPTIGRHTLRDTLISIANQLGPEDQVWVCPDMRVTDDDGYARALKYFLEIGTQFQWTLVPSYPPDNFWGHFQRNECIHLTTPGYHFCSIDDDDIYTPDALDTFREYACDVPCIFRMRMPEGHLLWKYEDQMIVGNYGTPCFLVPRTKGQMKQPYYGWRYIGDADYIEIASSLIGKPKFIDHVIAEIRPKEVKTI